MDDPQQLAAECLAAVTGVQRLVEPKPRPLTETEARRAIALARELEADLRKFLESEDFEAQYVDVPELDYLETLDQLTTPPSEAARQALLSNFENPELGLAYVAVLDRGVQWLLDQLPRRSRPTLVGDIPVEPSITEMDLFGRQWQIAGNPRQVMDDMKRGILVTDQVEAMKACFPLLYKRMAQIIWKLLGELHAKDQEWEPAWGTQCQVFTFAQMSPVDPGFAAETQAAAKAAAAQGDQQPAPGMDINLKSMDATTPIQRIANA